ncbi:type IV pilin-like G/H family protein [Pseudanabaena sp. FACHB-2040]|uniref:type IV pilin-like G/H family protein n=1 Tax=Pseudanabaena sp. FACHB-2040 TaxID=2692859 RepID=UPI001682297A|nr:type IV pilin-like G/H family protein [Pseudanabaena sp. FACHB-2040]MBD2261146.1 type IV pilin-like G/H family protein [Pseudanabaena sp. FACHB-2040]
MSSSTLVEQAKQGDPDAIASLINQSLQPKGITVNATLNRNFLTILAESETTPDQKSVTQSIEKGIGALKPQGIERIVIKGKASGQKSPAWRSLVELAQPAAEGIAADAKVRQWRGSGRARQALTWLKGTRDLLNTALLAGILLALLAGSRNLGPSREYWEYTVEGVEDGLFELTMQELGAQGWELASARRAVSGEGEYSEGLYEVIFRRPVTAAQARRNLKEAQASQATLAIEGSERLARLRLSSALRAQQFYRITEDRLASSFRELELSSLENDEDYTYSLTVINDRAAQVTAVGKQPGLRSYVGAVFVVGSSTEIIICSSEQPSQTAPPTPTLSGSTPQCAEGSQVAD